MASEMTAINHQLAILKERFVERTRTQLRELSNCLPHWQQGSLTLAELIELQQLLHRIAGSAGTFGYTRLGLYAGRIEQQVNDFLSQQASTSISATSFIIDELIQQLLQLTHYLEDNATLEPPLPLAPLAQEYNSQLLIVGEPLKALATSLNHYGFEARYVSNLDNLDATPISLIIAPSELIADIAVWNKKRADLYQHKAAYIIAVGEEGDFNARYRLAKLGASGLFTLPINIASLVERIEQLSPKHQVAQPSKVLLIDDDETLAEHYRLVLSKTGIKVRVMTQPHHLLETLVEFRPDIVLMDVDMGDYSGVTLARMIRFEAEWLSLPIIYLSSEQDRDQQLSALAQGADEFITKPISDPQLIRTVHILCYRARQLSKLVSCDGLTGLLNHSYIKQALTHEHSRVKRLGHSTTVAILDLDHFKKINDKHGHSVGDQVIKALANLLQQRLRQTDPLGRYGGEEFVAILTECDLASAKIKLEEICQLFAGLIFNSEHGDFSVTVSVGLAEINHFMYAEQALNAADRALYQRKRLGRNGVSCFTPPDTVLQEQDKH